MSINPEVTQVIVGLAAFPGVIVIGLAIDWLRNPTGIHRAPRPPATDTTHAEPTPYVGFDAAPWGLDDTESGEYRYCPEELRTRYSAVRADGSYRCWTCNTESPAGAL